MPWQEVIIHEVLELENEYFFKRIAEQTLAQQNQPVLAKPYVMWVDGIALIPMPFPDTEDVVRDKLNGKMHYATVAFTRISDRANYSVPIGREHIEIELRHGDNIPLMLDIAEFLKNFKHDPRLKTRIEKASPPPDS